MWPILITTEYSACFQMTLAFENGFSLGSNQFATIVGVYVVYCDTDIWYNFQPHTQSVM